MARLCIWTDKLRLKFYYSHVVSFQTCKAINKYYRFKKYCCHVKHQYGLEKLICHFKYSINFPINTIYLWNINYFSHKEGDILFSE